MEYYQFTQYTVLKSYKNKHLLPPLKPQSQLKQNFNRILFPHEIELPNNLAKIGPKLCTHNPS
jgi:hypothetical protein